MKFSQIAKGTRAEQKASYRYDGKDQPILLRPLSQGEELDVEGDAIKTAKAKGAEPIAGSPVYEAARMMAVLERAVLDPDSPPAAREAHFDGGAAQISELDPDTIAQLHALQQAWQEETSPSFRHKTTAELFALAKKLSEDEHDPLEYARLSLKTQWSLGPFMARLLRGSPVFNSWSGSSSEPPPKSSESPESPPAPPKDTSGFPTPIPTPEGDV